MKLNSVAMIAVILIALADARNATAITYVATLLHPTSTFISGALGSSTTKQVGFTEVGLYHAALWKGSAETWVDLNPSGFDGSTALDISGSNIIGYGNPHSKGLHALLWTEDGSNVVDLHPPSFGYSLALRTSGQFQVGYATEGNIGIDSAHALLWTGTAESVVDLTPPGYAKTFAEGVYGNIEVGFGDPTLLPTHALLWHGSATNFIDLNFGFFTSRANDVYENIQVGSSTVSLQSQVHATLWHGTSIGAVDLNPVGFSSSEAVAVSNAGEVGYAVISGSTNLYPHAFYWNGNARTGVDLHTSLLSLNPNFTYSYANDISDNGVIVGTAYVDSGHSYAVMWAPVPEPTSFATLICAIHFGFSWRRPNRIRDILANHRRPERPPETGTHTS